MSNLVSLPTKDLIGPALDWAVAKAEGWIFMPGPSSWYGLNPWIEFHDEKGVRRRQLWERAYSTDWEHGGPILGREGINITKVEDGCFEARTQHQMYYHNGVEGPTYLSSAMRCYVFSKFGELTEIPEVLLNADV